MRVRDTEILGYGNECKRNLSVGGVFNHKCNEGEETPSLLGVLTHLFYFTNIICLVCLYPSV